VSGRSHRRWLHAHHAASAAQGDVAILNDALRHRNRCVGACTVAPQPLLLCCWACLASWPVLLCCYKEVVVGETGLPLAGVSLVLSGANSSCVQIKNCCKRAAAFRVERAALLVWWSVADCVSLQAAPCSAFPMPQARLNFATGPFFPQIVLCSTAKNKFKPFHNPFTTHGTTAVPPSRTRINAQ
jgi:hypothetical protein